MANGDRGFPLIQALLKTIEQADQWDVLDKPVNRTYGPFLRRRNDSRRTPRSNHDKRGRK